MHFFAVGGGGFTLVPTCFEYEMEFVVFGLERPRQADPHLEILPSTDNKSVGLVEVGVVLGPVQPLPALHQVYRSHPEEEICGNATVRWNVLPASDNRWMVTSYPPACCRLSPASLPSRLRPHRCHHSL